MTSLGADFRACPLPCHAEGNRGNHAAFKNITMKHSIHQIPTMPPLSVTGAALRSVQAADAQGHAAHAALVAVHEAMIRHEDARLSNGIDATWCAEALALLDRMESARNGIRRLTTRWGWSTTDVRSVVHVSPDSITERRSNLAFDWPTVIRGHARTLKDAGVPPVSDQESRDAWIDAAARGC